MFGRIKRDLEAFIEYVVGRRLKYAFLYPATVVGQTANGEVEILPDDARVRGTGGTGIRVRHGLAGVTQTLQSGARVLLGFEAGEPDKPFVMAFARNAASATDATNIDAATIIDLGNTPTRGGARFQDSVQSGQLVFDPTIPGLFYKPDIPGTLTLYSAVVVNPTPGIAPAPSVTGTSVLGFINSSSAKVRVE